MKKIISLILVILLLTGQYSYSASKESVTAPQEQSHKETTNQVTNQVTTESREPRVFKFNSIVVDLVDKAQSDNVAKKIFSALNLTLSVLAVPFLFTGPTSNVLSNYALNYPLVQHVGDTIGSAVIGLSNHSTPYGPYVIYEVTRSKPLIMLVSQRKDCQWVVVEQADKKHFEFLGKGWGHIPSGKADSFLFKAIEKGDTVLHVGCINKSNEPLFGFTYNIKIVD